MDNISNSIINRIFSSKGEKIAIIDKDGERKTTYGEFSKIVNSYAFYLKSKGIKKGDVVVLCLSRSMEHIAMRLACNMIGGVFISINPNDPKEYNNHIINNCNHILILKDDILESITIDEYPNQTDYSLTDEDSGYIVYTSGTTGTPKGILHSRTFYQFYDSFCNEFSLKDIDFIYGATADMGFIASIMDMVPLFNEGTLHIISNETRYDILSLKDYIINHNIDSIFMLPNIFEAISPISTLKKVFIGSKPNNNDFSKSKTEVYNLYGSSEIFIVAYGDARKSNSIIDKTIHDSSIFIKSENGELLKPTTENIQGELCISTSFLMKEYLNNKELTDEILDSNNNLLFGHTKDLCISSNGGIELTGRMDSMVKIRGNRVDLVGIEYYILNIKGIKEVAVKSFSLDDDIYINAYYSTENNQPINDSIIKDELKKTLKSYMIPKNFIHMESFERNIHGKIDYSLLKPIDDAKILDDNGINQLNEGNLNEINKDDDLTILTGLFSQILGKEVHSDDDFIQLGGDSLSAMRLQLLIKNKFGINISSNEIIESKNPQNLLKIIKNKNNLKFDQYEFSYDKAYPLSESQLNIYLDLEIKDLGIAYNNAFKLTLDKTFTKEDIKNALETLINAHPILSSHITLIDGVPNLTFDRKPTIHIETNILEDKDFVKPFNIYESLSRFLITDNAIYVDFHHLISDGTSINIFANELVDLLYGKVNENNAYTDLKNLDDGFLRNYALEKVLLESEDYSLAKEFYSTMLVEADEIAELIPSIDGTESNVADFELDIDKDTLKSFLSANSITLNQFFTSVFAYTLSRFTGSSKVLFSLVEDGRGQMDLNNSFGMFVKTLPLLINCENTTIENFFKNTSSLINTAMKYDFYPFRILAKEYEIKSNILFQYSHNIINFESLDMTNLNPNLIADLTMNVFDKDNHFGFIIMHSSNFSEDFINRFAGVYKKITTEIINKKNLSEINYISDDDIEFLNQFNDNEVKIDYFDILEGFNDSLSKYPDNTLVSYKDTKYTYSEGAFVIQEVANSLRDLDVNSDDNVCIFVEKSEWYLLAALGVLTANATYVPLIEDFPNKRIKHILKDVNPKVVIVSDKTITRLLRLSLDIDTDILNVDYLNTKGRLDRLDIEEQTDILKPACILYTSGSTGTPKGVVILRINISALANFYVHKFNLTSQDTYGLFASYTFDASLIALFVIILKGAALDIVPDDIRLNIIKLNNHFIERNVTHTMLTTQLAKIFVNEIEETSIKYLITGGEKLGEIKIPKNFTLIDGYGPTEATAFICCSDVADKIDPSSVGFLNDNTVSFILDEEERRVPVGGVGKLYISTYQIYLKYLNLDELTDAVFIKNKFFDHQYFQWLYNTGDIARYLPDGSIGIIGRDDGQVKIRGNRIELTEVEAIIRNLDFIEDVTVQVFNNKGSKGLIAYVVTNEEFDPIELNNTICDYINRNYPTYMVPDFIKELDSIPLNVNGKVNKRALPKIDLSNLIVEYVPPSNDEEKLVVYAFKQIFNLEKVSVNDDFLRLGGDSLSAISLLSIIDDFNLTAADILKLRTPKVIANKIRSTKNLNIDLDKYTLETGCPLSEPQLNVYLDIKSKNKKDSYLLPLVIDIPNTYSVSDLIFTLRELNALHPILSGYISDENNTPYLKIGKNIDMKVINKYDEKAINAVVNEPFDLEKSLSRFLIVDDEGEIKLYATFHHLIFDGISSSVFENQLYGILKGGEFFSKDTSFLKVSAFSEEIQKLEDFKEAKLYYDKVLSDIDEVTPLLGDVIDNSNNTGLVELKVDKKVIKDFLANNNFSANALFTSVFAYTLSRFTGGEKVFFNITENGRDRFHNLDSIGMFVNTLPLIVDCSNKEISSFVNTVGEKIYNTLRYNFYPFRLLAKDFNIDSSIIFQYFPMDEEEDSDLSFFSHNLGEDLIEDKADLISDLTINMIEEKDSYSLNFVNSSKFSLNTINRILNTYELILNEFITKENLSDIEYITEEEIEYLDQFNENLVDIEYNDILEGFNHSLNKYPDNTLVTYENNSYSYSEGAYIIQEVANHLKSLNVSASENIPIFVNRSEWYLFASLGVLTINRCYVPIVEDFPDERIKYILKDTNAKTVIASDETIERLVNLSSELDIKILNISNINKEGKLTSLEDNMSIDKDMSSLEDMGNIDKDICSLKDKSDEISSIADYPACILYTSGSTGKPKGVVIKRINITSLADFYTKKFNLTSEDSYGLFASYNFDASLIALYVILSKGASLNIIPDDIRLNIEKLNNHFIKHNVTHTMLTTQLAKIFVNEIEETSIKYLITGGEKLGEIENPKNFTLIDGYGPTEATAFICCSDVKDKIDSSSVGLLNDNTISFILDKEGRRLPLGCVGELYISSYQLSLKYLNLEKETEKAFIENTIANSKYFKRLYRTGDIARYLPDGSIGIIGRDDGQVKIRGNRIELTEVESVIRNLYFIEDVTVQVIESNGMNNLIAYVVCDEKYDTSNLNEDIINIVQNNKPNYMIPSFIMELDSIPLNVNGKVDKKALPKPDLDELKIKYVAPSNKIEEDIVKSFEETLNLTNIGVNDNFFYIGGSSLTVVKLLINLKNKGYNLEYADIFNKKTPYNLAKQLFADKSYSNTNITEYDYGNINNVLKENTLDNFNTNEFKDIGNVLLAGATGFLGIHVLYEYIQNEEGIIYCMVRKSSKMTVKDKLKESLNYYFNDNRDENIKYRSKEEIIDLFDSRIIVVEGDITNPNDFDKLESLNIDTFINCAANVKHFSHSDEILEANYNGVVNALDFAEKINCKFVHISTVSVAGERLKTEEEIILDENSLFKGQIIDNKYNESKFLAEREVLERASQGLECKIIRVGNLMARDYDYKFQINNKNNTFLNFIKSFTIIKSINEANEFSIEFSPINIVAKCVIELSKTPSKCCLFHPYNPNKTNVNLIINALNELDFNISKDSDQEFNIKLENILKDPSKCDDIWGFIHYSSIKDGKTEESKFKNDYTLKVLSELGISWPLIEKSYLFNFFKSLKELGFFN